MWRTDGNKVPSNDDCWSLSRHALLFPLPPLPLYVNLYRDLVYIYFPSASSSSSRLSLCLFCLYPQVPPVIFRFFFYMSSSMPVPLLYYLLSLLLSFYLLFFFSAFFVIRIPLCMCLYYITCSYFSSHVGCVLIYLTVPSFFSAFPTSLITVFFPLAPVSCLLYCLLPLLYSHSLFSVYILLFLFFSSLPFFSAFPTSLITVLFPLAPVSCLLYCLLPILFPHSLFSVFILLFLFFFFPPYLHLL